MIRFKYDRRTSGVQCHCNDRLYFVIKDADLADGYIERVLNSAESQPDGSGTVELDDTTDVWFEIMDRCNKSDRFPLTIRKSE